MRVLMLTDLYPPFIGGIEQHVRNLSLGLVERGHEVTVATMSVAGQPAVAGDDGVRVIRLRGTAQRLESYTSPAGSPHAPPFPDPEIVAGLREEVRRRPPDVVHGHNWMVRSFIPLKRRSTAALVYTLHDYGVVCAKRSFVYHGLPCSGPGPLKCLECAGRNYGAARGAAIVTGNWLMRPAERSAVDMFLPVSTAVARGNELVEQAMPHEVVPNFVPDDVAERSDPADPALAALPSLPFWLYVGALSRHKGLHTLLAAYRSIAGAPPLVVIGAQWADTPAEFPANVTVLRNLPHAAVMAAWARASLAIVPSVFPDPCPTVAMEAMACGLPIVASDGGGLPDLVDDGITGLLVPPANVRALRAALAAMANKPDLAKQMGAAGRQKVGAFTASAVVGRIEGIYARAVEARA